jgi:hypothetical protein
MQFYAINLYDASLFADLSISMNEYLSFQWQNKIKDKLDPFSIIKFQCHQDYIYIVLLVDNIEYKT